VASRSIVSSGASVSDRAEPGREGRGLRLSSPFLSPAPPGLRSCDGGVWLFREVFAGFASSASSSAIRAACRSINAACSVSSASFSRSLRRYRNGGVIHTLTHIQPARATRKCQPGEQLRMTCSDMFCAPGGLK